MARHDDTVYLRHMLDHAKEAVEMVCLRSRSDLDADRQLNLSLVRLVEIIGEAAARVNPIIRQNHAEVPWIAIIGTRNRLIHGYDRVDFDILWRIVSHELPPLIGQLTSILQEKPAGS